MVYIISKRVASNWCQNLYDNCSYYVYEVEDIYGSKNTQHW